MPRPRRDRRPERSDGSTGVFVTGTGTEVGKTVVAAALARTLAAEGRSRRRLQALRHRPRRTRRDDATTSCCAGPRVEQSDEEIAPYRYGPPASPHLAAALAGEEIDPERLLRAPPAPPPRAPRRSSARASAACSSRFAPGYLVRDLAVDLGYPLVVVASPGLGTINHTLLTIEAARAAGLEVAAVVLTPWPQEPTAIERSNRETIAAPRRGRGPRASPTLDLADPASWPTLRTGRPSARGRSRRGSPGRARPRSRRLRAIAAAASGSAGAFFASSSARATSPRTAFAMWETALRSPATLAERPHREQRRPLRLPGRRVGARAHVDDQRARLVGHRRGQRRRARSPPAGRSSSAALWPRGGSRESGPRAAPRPRARWRSGPAAAPSAAARPDPAARRGRRCRPRPPAPPAPPAAPRRRRPRPPAPWRRRASRPPVAATASPAAPARRAAAPAAPRAGRR